MRRSTLLVALVAALASVVPLSAQADSGAGADRYIVVLKDAVDSNAVANLHAARYGLQIGHVYSYALHGYSAVIPNDRVAALRTDSNVAYVEPDGTAYATAQSIPWGIAKIAATTSSQVSGDGSGAVTNVHAYVIDTGVDSGHPDLNFAGSVNFANGPNKDCNGHGSHVAGIIGAKDNSDGVVGVAPGIALHAVRVLGCGGSGSWSGVVAGIDWVTANAIKPAIANMSLGGSATNSVDQAVRNSAASGVFYALAAGNDGGNACNQSPARAGAGTDNGIATVAATDSGDNEASWSNYGTCVDIWAPGVSILSTYKSGGYATLSGTSMASPHVGGGGALYLSTHTSSSPSAVESALKSAADTTTKNSKDGTTIKRENVDTF
jgi:subtilisin family serine protease